MKLVEETERQGCIQNGDASNNSSSSSSTGSTSSGDSVELKSDANSNSRWSMGMFTKAVTSYLPGPVSDVWTQDRAFASVQLNQAGRRYQCVVTKLEKEPLVMAACEDGFLYVYNFPADKGGECKLIRAHDLRSPLDGITGKCLTIIIDNVHVHRNHLIETIEVAEINLDDNSNCDKIISTPEKKIIPAAIGSYASVLKGREKNKMSGTVQSNPTWKLNVEKICFPSTESDKYRDLSEAIEYPQKSMFEEVQFPPVQTVRAAE